MRKTKIYFVYSSHLDYSIDDKFEKNIKNTIGCDFEIVRFENKNQYSLSEVYNKGLEKYNFDDSILVFAHNDIKILTQNWGKILLNKFNYYNHSIIGVAGSRHLGESAVWWEDKSKMYGIVLHQDPLNPENSWVNEYSKNIVGIADVVTVDGLFFAVDGKKIIHKFDEEMDNFHFYDLGLCVPNYLDGCDIGVITDIRILHKSVGLTNDKWEENRERFRKKYSDYFPMNIFNIKCSHPDLILERNPKLSVIIPTKNNFNVLYNNLNSFSNYVNYDNYEIIIADTGSDEIIKKRYKDEFNDFGLNIKIIEYDYYNFAKINNDVVKNHISSDTELLLFCNDDIELLNDAVSILVQTYLENKNAGTIGIRLHYENESIQHNGISIKEINKQLYISHKDLGATSNYSTNINKNSIGNTAAFMLVNKDLFISSGGYSEKYNECFEDVELNLSLLKQGKINITNSNAVAIHFESLSRKKNSDIEDRMRIDFDKIRDYFYNTFKKNKNCIYTVIIGNYDNLNEHFEKKNNWDYYCITDNKQLKSNKWKMIYVDESYPNKMEQSRVSRYYKTHYYEFFDSYENILYIDARMNIVNDLDIYRSLMNESDILLMIHPDAKNINEEIDRVVIWHLDTPEMGNKIRERYKNEGYKYNNGLNAGGVLMFKNNDKIKKFFTEWWDEISKYSYRDQLSLNYVLWKNSDLKVEQQPFRYVMSNFFIERSRNTSRVNVKKM